ncbi:MAG: hypothetical protein ACI9N9_003036 [Enterobacterales bacterium]|jgi:hypothetical protein
MDFFLKNKYRLIAILSLSLLGLILCSAIASGSSKREAREYHLKAAFLRYVAKFVEWPESVLVDKKLNVCILGNIPYYKAIDSINGKVVNELELTVFKVPDVASSIEKNCQILFIAKTEEDHTITIIDAIKDKPILSFGDMDSFAENGGDMNFYIMNNRLAIMINPLAIEQASLTISPRMMRLVTVLPPIQQ